MKKQGEAMNEPTMETLARRLLGRSMGREGVLLFTKHGVRVNEKMDVG